MSLTGMASGLDTESIITQLMAIEGQSKTRLANQQRVVDARRTVLNDIARQVRGLNTAIADLRSVTTFGDVQTISSSDSAKIGARQVGAGPVGTYTVTIDKLARSEQRSYDVVVDGGGLTTTAEQLTIGDGTTSKVVDIAAGSSLEQIAAAINATDGITVYAGVVAGQLSLSARELGKSISLSGSAAQVTEDATKQKLWNLTEYSINGVAQTPTKESVVTPGGLPGIELTLKAVGSSDVTIGAPGPDTEKIKTKVQAFVDAYNATIELVRSKLTETKVQSPATIADFQKGVLRGDPALTAMLSGLRGLMGGTTADTTTAIDTLAEIGVALPGASADGTTSPEARAGKIALDTDKLLSALSSDPAAVENLFRSAGSIGEKLAGVVEPVIRTSDGYITRATQAADEETQRINQRTADLERRLALKEERLRMQFTALETALNGSQNASGWLSGQIAGLPTWSA